MNINDFAHIPWEDTPNFPKAPQRKEFLHKLLVKHPGYLPGVCGWDLREYHAVDLPPTQDSRWIPVPRFVGQGILKKTFIVAVTGWGVIDIRYDILLFAFFGGVIYFLRDSIILIHHFSLPFGEYFFVKHLLPSDEVAPTLLECVILLGESISRSRTILRSAAVQCS